MALNNKEYLSTIFNNFEIFELIELYEDDYLFRYNFNQDAKPVVCIGDLAKCFNFTIPDLKKRLRKYQARISRGKASGILFSSKEMGQQCIKEFLEPLHIMKVLSS